MVSLRLEFFIPLMVWIRSSRFIALLRSFIVLGWLKSELGFFQIKFFNQKSSKELPFEHEGDFLPHQKQLIVSNQ